MKKILSVFWVDIQNGSIAIGHRPNKKKFIPYLAEQGCTHVLTLLSETENANEIGEFVEKNGMGWLWFPMASGNPPDDNRIAELQKIFEEIKILCNNGRFLCIARPEFIEPE